jgi:hypothetical protein
MPTRLLAVVVATAVMLAGCTNVFGDATTEADDLDLTLDVTPDMQTSEPDGTDDPGVGRPPITLSPCDDAVKESIDATIAAQTRAFRDGDFDAAYALASPSFQAGMPIDVFARLIQLNYSQLLTADNARSGSCEADVANKLATIVVRFETASDPAYTLRYVVELVGGQWRISGANPEVVADTVA